MKKFIISTIVTACTITSFPVHADNCPSAVADSAYAADDFQMAVACYEQTLRDEGSSSDLYYNLGNALYRDGQLGKSIIAYERALKLDPSNDDARFNLDFVNSRLVDKQTSNLSTMDIVCEWLISLMSPNAWAWTASALFITFLVLLSLYLFTTPVAIRKIGFFGGIGAFILSIGSFMVSSGAAAQAISHNEGVVISQSVIMSSAPRIPKDRNEEIALIHEGSKLSIIDSLTNRSDSTLSKWYKVKIDREHQGWVVAESIEII